MQELFRLNSVRMLLELDCVIHGSVICHVLRGRNVADFVKKNPIIVSCEQHMLVYVERFLNPCKKTTDFDSFAHPQYNYEIQELGMTIKFIFHVGATSMISTLARVDVELLCLGRDALFVQKTCEDLSVCDLMTKCASGTFGLLPAMTYTTQVVDHVLEMSEDGWKTATSSVKLTDRTFDDPCPICHETMTNEQNVETGCKHVFHAKCWRQLLVHTASKRDEAFFTFPSTPKKTLCPLCRTAYAFPEALVS